jgi:undecaprenyl-diphosphatase
MLETLNNLDTQWFWWVNSHHCSAMDWVMWPLSQHWCMAAVIVLAFCLLTLRYEPRRWWLVLIGIGLCFLLADQGSVHLFKNTVCRLRPCHALEDVRMFRTNCGGQYGFVSSHAANVFAVALFLMLRYWKRVKRQWPLLLLTLWAIATCYSRPYLGKHYPGDVICGALFGAIIALIVWLIIGVIEKKFCKSETK